MSMALKFKLASTNHAFFSYFKWLDRIVRWSCRVVYAIVLEGQEFRVFYETPIHVEVGSKGSLGLEAEFQHGL